MAERLIQNERKQGRKTAVVIGMFDPTLYPAHLPTHPPTGAGVGGTSTAARLAHAGFSVTVLEKNSFTGGRCSLIRTSDGYRFDQGPSLLLLPGLFHQTFRDLGTSLEAEGVELRKCDPNYRIWFGDGEQFVLSSDLSVMKREVEKWEGPDGYERYLAFLRESHRHYELSVQHVLLRNFESLAAMLRLSFLRNVFALHPFESIWSRASTYFWTERLRRVFTFGSMYMGMSPFDAPGTYSLLQYTELAEGIWYPIGGFHRVIQALVEIGERKGVQFRLNTAVEEILIEGDGGRAVGVRLEGGEVLKADVVVNNSDLVYAYSNLLAQPHPPAKNPHAAYAASLAKRPASCSSISFYWALSRPVPQLEAHNIFLADEYQESFDSIFKKNLIPTQPSFYVNVPTRIDSSAAPSGGESVVVLVPVGHLVAPPSDSSLTHHSGTTPTTHQDWPAITASARTTILETIRARTGADLAPLILHERTNDPMTWQEKFHLDKGAILGLSHSFFNVLAFRPSTRGRRPHALDSMVGSGVVGRVLELVVDLVRGVDRDVQGLYMVGASAHPGTGVPICLAGGRLVAEQILGDEAMEVPWRLEEEMKGTGTRKELDRVERPTSSFGRAWMVLLVFLGMLWLQWMR